MKPILSILATILLIQGVSIAQKIANFEFDVNTSQDKLNTPVSVNLDEITSLPDSVLSLYEIDKGHEIPVFYQIESGRNRELIWIVELHPNKKTYKFQLVKETSGAKPSNTMSFEDIGKSILLKRDNQTFLQYNYATIYPPAGIDTAFKRSGFIHPLYAPHGQVLTRIQAPDHYHHYGIWNPWTHVLFDGDTVDFWNLRDRKGTVRFANMVSKVSGPVFTEYQALHKHIAFKKDGTEKIAMNELQTVRIYQSNNPDYYITDITIQLNCAGNQPVKLLTYRYGGLGWRATEEWTKENSETLTSEGKTRADADGTTARWCIVQGSLGNDYGGIVMMSCPTNYNHPEPLRIWPATPTNRGDVYANFSPTKNKDWLLVPGQTYTLKYRFLVFNGKFTAEKAENGWRNFVKSYKMKITTDK